MFRVSRDRGPGPFLNLRIIIFCLGGGIAAAGIISQKNWIINLAIGVLLIGVILRLFSRGESATPPE